MFVAAIPGYLEAVIQERLVRDVALLGLPESIGAFEVRSMTFEDYIALRICNSPFIPPWHGCTRTETASFLWLLAPTPRRDQKSRARFMKRFRNLTATPEQFALTVKAAFEYVRETFQDRPALEETMIPEASYYSDIVTVIANLAREYGWDYRACLKLPLKVGFQCLKEIRDVRCAMGGQRAILGNPSDVVRNQWLQDRNKSLKRN